MFEIPDDDDFWETLPLEDISDSVKNDKHGNFSNDVTTADKHKNHSADSLRNISKNRCTIEHFPTENSETHFIPPQAKFQPNFQELHNKDISEVQSGSTTSWKHALKSKGIPLKNPVDERQKVATHEKPEILDGQKESGIIEHDLRRLCQNSESQFPPAPQNSVLKNASYQKHAIVEEVNRHTFGNISDNQQQISKRNSGSLTLAPLSYNAADKETREPNLLNSSRENGIDSECSNTIRRKHVKRKFPGPAGLLPNLAQEEISRDDISVEFEEKPSKAVKELKIWFEDTQCIFQCGSSDDVILSSQSSEDLFQSQCWLSLIQDLGKDNETILQKFSVNSSILKARKKQLPRGKVPLIFGVVEHIEFEGSDASITLKDKTAKIRGSLHRDIVKDHAYDITPGCVLVLRQVSVISPTSRNHYLNITPNNVVTLYIIKSTSVKRIQSADQTTLPDLVQSVERELKTVLETTPRRNSHNDINNNNQRCVGKSNIPQTRQLWNGSFSSPQPELKQSERFSTPISSYGENFGNTPTRFGSNPIRTTTPGGHSIRTTQYTPKRTPSMTVGPTSSSVINSVNQSSLPSADISLRKTESLPWKPSAAPHFVLSDKTASICSGSKVNSSLLQCKSDNHQNGSFLQCTPQQPKPNSKFTFKQKSPTIMNGPQFTAVSSSNAKMDIRNMAHIASTQIRSVVNCYTRTAEKSSALHENKKLPHNSDNLWQDDLTDDVLSQLSDDMF